MLPPSVKAIDLFECARADPKVPIETSIKTLADLVKEGKIRGIGLSEASAATIRRAHAVHPIAAVEIELSLFTPKPLHNGIVEACHERKSNDASEPRNDDVNSRTDRPPLPIINHSGYSHCCIQPRRARLHHRRDTVARRPTRERLPANAAPLSTREFRTELEAG